MNSNESTICETLLTSDSFLREFPSLSNTSQLQSTGQSSMWSAGGSRGLGGPVQRSQGGASISTQPAAPDDVFGPAPRIQSGSQGSFRFGNQASLGQASHGQPSGADEFPPLSRNANGDIGQERGSNLMSSLGYSSQQAAGQSALQNARSGNGLLNALSANVRAAEARSAAASGAAGEHGHQSATICFRG